MVRLAFEHGLEDDLARLFGREVQQRQRLAGDGSGVEGIEIAVLALKAPRQARQRNIQRLDVLGRVGGFHLDHQRIFALATAAHRHPFEFDAFAADRLDELHEDGRTHHRNELGRVSAEIHAAQAATECLLGQDIARRRVGAQADDGGDIAHVPAFLEHQHRDDGLVLAVPGVDAVGFAAQGLEFFLVLAFRGLRNLAVVLGVDDEHCALQLGADAFQMRTHVVAVAGVIDHHEQHGLLAQALVLVEALLPLLDAERQIVGVLLVKEGAGMRMQACATGFVGQHRVLDDALVNGFDQRVVADGLHEDRAVVVARRGRHIDLQRQSPVLLQHAVMNISDAAEPGHARVVDVVRFVVEDGEFVDLAHEFAEVGLAVRRLARRFGAEGLEEIVAQVVVVERGLAHVAEIDAVDVGQKQVAGVTHHAHVVL